MGCLLHELVFNVPAFKDDYAVLEHYFEHSSFIVDLDDSYDEAARASISQSIFRMLQKHPSERPSASALSEEFCNHYWSNSALGTHADTGNPQGISANEMVLEDVMAVDQGGNAVSSSNSRCTSC